MQVQLLLAEFNFGKKLLFLQLPIRNDLGLGNSHLLLGTLHLIGKIGNTALIILTHQCRVTFLEFLQVQFGKLHVHAGIINTLLILQALNFQVILGLGNRVFGRAYRNFLVQNFILKGSGIQFHKQISRDGNGFGIPDGILQIRVHMAQRLLTHLILLGQRSWSVRRLGLYPFGPLHGGTFIDYTHDRGGTIHLVLNFHVIHCHQLSSFRKSHNELLVFHLLGAVVIGGNLLLGKVAAA